MDSYDRFVGGLYGVAIGDALGAPHEFTRASPKIQYTGLFTDIPVTVQFRFTQMIIEPGSVTDDTEMTIQLLDSILENNNYIVEKTIKKYLEWANLKNTSLGKNTRALMKGVTTVKGFYNRQAKIDTTHVESNGSLMRCLPIALLSDWKKISDIDVSLTNNNPVNRECSIIYLTLIRHFLFEEPAKGGSSIPLKFKCKQKSIKTAIKNAIKGIIIDVSVQKGWVVHALYVALITLFNVNSTEEGMKFIATHFIHGDTDTIMAISGGLLGSKYGFINMNNEVLTSQNIVKLNDFLLKSKRPSFNEQTLKNIESYLQKI